MTKNYIKYEIIKMNDISKFNYIWIYTVPWNKTRALDGAQN
jgi:hypothetical protein